jgi:thioredoxin reductase
MKKKTPNLLEEKRKAERVNAFDVAIIGAGYAGLSAALLLGRYLVPTVIFDGGKARNSMTRRVHGYLGFENVSPKALLRKASKDVLKYKKSVTTIKSRVSSAKKHRRYFVVRTGGRTFRAKYLIIATGIEDVKPRINNFQKFDGHGAWHCPYCDGHEATGKRLALIVSGQSPVSYAKEFLGWTQDITMFLHDGCRLEEKERKQAEALGIHAVSDSITEITGSRGRLAKRLACTSGRHYNADVIFYQLGYRVQSQLTEQLGCQLDEGYVKVDAEQQTTVAGVYAAGDVDTDRHYVVLAAAAGARAAISIYERLLKEAIKAKMQGHKSP